MVTVVVVGGVWADVFRQLSGPSSVRPWTETWVARWAGPEHGPIRGRRVHPGHGTHRTLLCRTASLSIRNTVQSKYY